MQRTRAWRRSQNERLKNNRKNYWFFGTDDDGKLMIAGGTGRKLGMALATPAPCSCWMGGNPRKYYKGKPEAYTIQERRATQKERCYAIVTFKEQSHEQNISQEGC